MFVVVDVVAVFVAVAVVLGTVTKYQFYLFGLSSDFKCFAQSQNTLKHAQCMNSFLNELLLSLLLVLLLLLLLLLLLMLLLLLLLLLLVCHFNALLMCLNSVIPEDPSG